MTLVERWAGRDRPMLRWRDDFLHKGQWRVACARRRAAWCAECRAYLRRLLARMGDARLLRCPFALVGCFFGDLGPVPPQTWAALTDICAAFELQLFRSLRCPLEASISCVFCGVLSGRRAPLRRLRTYSRVPPSLRNVWLARLRVCCARSGVCRGRAVWGGGHVVAKEGLVSPVAVAHHLVTWTGRAVKRGAQCRHLRGTCAEKPNPSGEYLRRPRMFALSRWRPLRDCQASVCRSPAFGRHRKGAVGARLREVSVFI